MLVQFRGKCSWYSKWIEMSIVNSATSVVTIQKLRCMFSTHGLPRVVVSDNGSVFTSSEFQQFMAKNGIHHIRTAPYHPASNGLCPDCEGRLKETLQWVFGNQSFPIPFSISTDISHYYWSISSSIITGSQTTFTPGSPSP